MEKIKGQYRQGDVLIEHVPDGTIPAEAKVRKTTIVALGEATGHNHAFATNMGAQVLEVGDNIFARLVVATPLTHQEHGVIEVMEVGEEVITIQREYTPAEIRRVQD
jgi:hypothetical protein